MTRRLMASLLRFAHPVLACDQEGIPGNDAALSSRSLVVILPVVAVVAPLVLGRQG